MMYDLLILSLDTSTFINLEKKCNEDKLLQLIELRKQGLIMMPIDVYGVFYELLQNPEKSKSRRFEILNELCALDVIAIDCADEDLPAPEENRCVTRNGFMEVIVGDEIPKENFTLPDRFRKAVLDSGIMFRHYSTKEDIICKMKVLFYLIMMKPNAKVNHFDLLILENIKEAKKISDDIALFLISWAENNDFMSGSKELNICFIDGYNRCMSNFVNFSSFLISTKSSKTLIDSAREGKHKFFIEDFCDRMKKASAEFGSVNEAINVTNIDFMQRNHGRELFQWIFCKHLYTRYDIIARKAYAENYETIPEFHKWIYDGLSFKGSVRPRNGMPEPNDVCDFLHLSSLRDADVITVDTKFYNMLQNTTIDTSILNTKWIKATELDELVDYTKKKVESRLKLG